MPSEASVAAVPGAGLPSARRRWTASSARIAGAGCSGTESRTAHGVVASGCRGSSRVTPQTWRPKDDPGTTSARVVAAGSRSPPPTSAAPGRATGAFSESQSAASVQWSGIAAWAPTGASRPGNAGATATVPASTTTMATATGRLRSGWATAVQPPAAGAAPPPRSETPGTEPPGPEPPRRPESSSASR